MRAEAQDTVCTSVAESQSQICLVAVATKSHYVNACQWVDVHQSYFVRRSIAAIVKQTYLHATWMTDAGIEQSYL